MTDCLASTGNDTLWPLLIVAGVLLIAGVIAVIAMKRRSGWMALAIIPLLLGASLLGANAPSAQAATGTPCPTSSSAAAAPVETSSPTPSPTLTPTPTPTPTPTCTPATPLESYVVDGTAWTFDSTDGFNGLIEDLSTADTTAIAALLAVSTDEHPPAAVTVPGFQNADGGGFDPAEVTFEKPIYSGGTDVNIILSTDQAFLYVPQQFIDDAAVAQLPPDGNGFFGTAMSVVISVSYDDGCGGTLTSTITVDEDILTA